MEFTKTFLGAVAGTALVALASGAYAAGPKSGDTVGPTPLGQSASPPAPAPSMSPTSPSVPPGRMAPTINAGKPMHPPGFIVGKAVVNAEGDKIGSVADIDGDRVIVSVGGFLGIGAHDVAVPWSQLRLSGSGGKTDLQTSLTKDELKALPEYEEPGEASRGSGGSTAR